MTRSDARKRLAERAQPPADIREAVAGLAEVLAEHDRYWSSAGWNGSPDPGNWRNIAYRCTCNERIHDASQDTASVKRAHRAHVAEVIHAAGYLSPSDLAAPEATDARTLAESIVKITLGKDEWNRRGWKGQGEAIDRVEAGLAAYDQCVRAEALRGAVAAVERILTDRLAAHDRRVRAEAWDGGAAAFLATYRAGSQSMPPNPYREAEQ